MKTLKALAAGLALCLAGAAHAGYVYVGKWHVGDGPQWSTTPDTYTGQEAAAFLFGGNASDYAISTVSNQVADINFKTFLDGWGDSQYLFTAMAQDWKIDIGAPGYNDQPGEGSAYSAFVLDHSCSNRYGNLAATCADNEPGVNYAFRLERQEVPEPAGLALLGLGLAAGAWRSRRRQA